MRSKPAQAKGPRSTDCVAAWSCRRIDALRVLVLRREGDRLDPTDAYWSSWYGGSPDDRYPILGGDGRPIVGFRAIVREQLRAVGVIQKGDLSTCEPPLVGSLRFEGHPFREVTPAGAEWIGLSVSLREMEERAAVSSLRSFYLQDSQEFMGPRYGTETSERVTVRAQSGYQLQGLQVNGRRRVQGLRVWSQKVDARSGESGYWSDWIKEPDETAPILGAASEPVIGLYGLAGQEIKALGLVQVGATEPGARSRH